MADFPRLIEHAFPLKQASLDSVHEKNVRHGHISTLHIWPARRPLAASRAALIATLLPDPGDPEKRRELCEKIGGKVVKKIEKKKMPNGQIVERIKEETEGGILHWGRETDNADTLEWFRQEIRKAYGGRAPKVLDPFSGGGAIPLEAMRLGCQATAVDINPVAWFILKCTLEYPQKLAGQKRPLPAFILENEAFMEGFYKANPSAEGQGKATKKQKESLFAASGVTHAPEADLAWQVRAWGQWVLGQARNKLAELYPTYADFEPLKKDQTAYEHRPMTLVPLKPDGTADIDSLNKDSSKDYLAVKSNPRWVAKPTVAYLWARTVTCKNCRSQLPLLKTRWLCKKDRKRVLLTMQCELSGTKAPATLEENRAKVASKLASSESAGVVENPSATKRVVFGIQANVPVSGGNAAQKREHDKRLAAGTMSRAGAKCPCCPAIMTMEDIRVEGKAGRLGSVMTAVVVDGSNGKEYRLPTEHELAVAAPDETRIEEAFKDIPFGVPDEPTPKGGGSGAGRAFSVQGYGLMKWRDLFTARQLMALGTFVDATRQARQTLAQGYPAEWVEAVGAYLCVCVSRMCDRLATGATWDNTRDGMSHVFHRFALPIVWDYGEANPLSEAGGSFEQQGTWVSLVVEHASAGLSKAPSPTVIRHSSATLSHVEFDAIVTDPPYYDAIPYSDLMDFFYIWQRRALFGISQPIDRSFELPLTPKWDHEANDGELIDDSSRHGNDASKSKQVYEDGMARVFTQCGSALVPDGRLVIVFANKQPDAWETLVSAIVRAGFTVDGSWPIQTEMGNRTRALGAAALASSVWLVCKKRSAAARPGWDTGVLEEMRENISRRLQTYWDAGIRGPDFIWAATGPALEAYSKHPAVKKADQPGAIMTVAEFLNHVRRLVVDYVVGKVLTGEEDGEIAASASDRLDEPTAYYLLHRNDFGLDEAPVGTCILYAVSCGLSDSDLVQTWDLLAKTGADAPDDTDEVEGPSEEADGEEEVESSGGKVRLKAWSQRKNRLMGYEAPNGRAVPLIDRVHRLMHLWKAGDLHKVDEYLDEHGMRRHELFKRLLQSLIELARKAGDREELQYLESLSNHLGAKGAKADADQMDIKYNED